MIYGHHDYVAAPREICSVSAGRRAWSPSQNLRRGTRTSPAACGRCRRGSNGGRPDVKNKAIFSFGRKVFSRYGKDVRRWRCRWVTLRGAVPIGQRIAHAGPVRRFRRRHKPIRTRCIRAVRNSLENFDPVIVNAANFAESSFGDNVIRFLRIQLMQKKLPETATAAEMCFRKSRREERKTRRLAVIAVSFRRILSPKPHLNSFDLDP